jgi:hypothetical protein
VNAAGTWSLGNAFNLALGPAQPLTSATSTTLVKNVLDSFTHVADFVLLLTQRGAGERRATPVTPSHRSVVARRVTLASAPRARDAERESRAIAGSGRDDRAVLTVGRNDLPAAVDSSTVFAA